jgi:hypothetical protein
MISKMWLLGTSFFVGIIAFGCSEIWAQDPGGTGFHASVDGQFRYGNIGGFVQIPRGGGVGTTSNERPKFDEIGINQAAIGAPSVTLGWNNHNIYGVARIIRLSGSDDLDTTLISNGTTFPAGTHVSGNTRLDWYGLGYEYRFAYKYNNEGSVVSFYPAIGFALLNFDYNLNGPPRSFRFAWLRESCPSTRFKIGMDSWRTFFGFCRRPQFLAIFNPTVTAVC